MPTNRLWCQPADGNSVPVFLSLGVSIPDLDSCFKIKQLDFILCGSAESARRLKFISPRVAKDPWNRSSLHQPQDPDSLTWWPSPYRNPNSRMPPSYQPTHTCRSATPHTTLTRPLTNPELAPLHRNFKLNSEQSPNKFSSPLVLHLHPKRLQLKKFLRLHSPHTVVPRNLSFKISCTLNNQQTFFCRSMLIHRLRTRMHKVMQCRSGF